MYGHQSSAGSPMRRQVQPSLPWTLPSPTRHQCKHGTFRPPHRQSRAPPPSTQARGFPVVGTSAHGQLAQSQVCRLPPCTDPTRLTKQSSGSAADALRPLRLSAHAAAPPLCCSHALAEVSAFLERPLAVRPATRPLPETCPPRLDCPAKKNTSRFRPILFLSRVLPVPKIAPCSRVSRFHVTANPQNGNKEQQHAARKHPPR